jgi:carbamoyltransferase
MIVLGISPLDKDATASLVQDGKVLFAAAEERYSRRKQHAGFPRQAIDDAMRRTGLRAQDIDEVAYAFLTWDQEADAMRRGYSQQRAFEQGFPPPDLQRQLSEAARQVPQRKIAIAGLRDPNERMVKGALKQLAYRIAGGGTPLLTAAATRYADRQWIEGATRGHQHWQQELHQGLEELGLLSKLKRYEHHLSHAANAHLTSGFDRSLIVTLDGYGTGLAGSVSLGEGSSIRRLHSIPFPSSLGSFYESVTSSLGFRPDRHAGKIVGLAAYGDPKVLAGVLLSRFKFGGGDYRILDNLNIFFSRHLAVRFPKVDLAAAYQHALEAVAAELVRHWVAETGCDSVVLSGGVTANVKMNQRIHEVKGVRRTFIDPNMGDGGCGTGLALYRTWSNRPVEPLRDAYLGPSFTDAEIRAELERNGLSFTQPADLAAELARRIHSGEVIGRFDGRMEYGPRALGNRSILYHARDPHVNQWLNQRLGRTEFMPFAPVTLWEHRHECYRNLEGAELAAQFMTITFDCTDSMRRDCPAAVHVDGTARPQLVREEINPGYYAILREYHRLTGVPSLINTSFNMHEEPIVCTPHDAVRAFLDGRLDGLAIGSYFVANPRQEASKKMA